MITEKHRKHLSESHMGIKRTPESLVKFSKSMKRKWANPEYRNRISRALKGHVVTQETKRKISKSHIKISNEQEDQIIALYLNGLTGDEIKSKLKLGRDTIYGCLKRKKIETRPSHVRNGHIPWNKGKEGYMTANCTSFKKGQNAWNKGIPASKESIDNLRKGLQNWVNLKGYYPNWQGGISFEPYSPEFNDKLKYEIRKRDNFTCQFPSCGMKENGRAHNCHHINYNKKDNRKKNLISLCYKCHTKTNGKREYWEIHFQNKLTIKEILS